MKTPELVDANVILRYLLKDDAVLFPKAFSFLEQVRTGAARMIVLDSVLTESVYVLLKVYQADRATIADNLRELLCYRGVTGQGKDEMIEALKLFKSTTLSIVDCLLCATARSRGLRLSTFDEKLSRISHPLPPAGE